MNALRLKLLGSPPRPRPVRQRGLAVQAGVSLDRCVGERAAVASERKAAAAGERGPARRTRTTSRSERWGERRDDGAEGGGGAGDGLGQHGRAGAGHHERDDGLAVLGHHADARVGLGVGLAQGRGEEARLEVPRGVVMSGKLARRLDRQVRSALQRRAGREDGEQRLAARWSMARVRSSASASPRPSSQAPERTSRRRRRVLGLGDPDEHAGVEPAEPPDQVDQRLDHQGGEGDDVEAAGWSSPATSATAAGRPRRRGACAGPGRRTPRRRR